MSVNWLKGMDQHMEEPGRPMVMPVFAGQKLVVVGGSSGMGRETAADVVLVWDERHYPPKAIRPQSSTSSWKRCVRSSRTDDGSGDTVAAVRRGARCIATQMQ